MHPGGVGKPPEWIGRALVYTLRGLVMLGEWGRLFPFFFRNIWVFYRQVQKGELKMLVELNLLFLMASAFTPFPLMKGFQWRPTPQ